MLSAEACLASDADDSDIVLVVARLRRFSADEADPFTLSGNRFSTPGCTVEVLDIDRRRVSPEQLSLTATPENLTQKDGAPFIEPGSALVYSYRGKVEPGTFDFGAGVYFVRVTIGDEVCTVAI